MKLSPPPFWQKAARLIASGSAAFLLLAVVMYGLRTSAASVPNHPVPPPEGRPKLSTSVKQVTPTLANTSGETLYYVIELRNTGSYTATSTTLVDPIPPNTTYNGDAQASHGPNPVYNGSEVSWTGDVGFDETVVISFSVSVESDYEGTVQNTAVISQSLISQPVTVAAETTVTDSPILAIGKRSEPAKPGANQPLSYTLVVTNVGQAASGLPVTVTDKVPAGTALRTVGADGSAGPGDKSVQFARSVSLDFGDTSVFTFSVDVGDVLSGTVITNDDYGVNSDQTELAAGAVHTTTVVDPILSLSKEAWPEPPGSNREMTYTLTLLNQGSLATGITVTDDVPAGVTYVRGGNHSGGVVSWDWPRLDTGAAATFTYTVFISDVAEVPVINSNYEACSAEGVCGVGEVITHVVGSPDFVASGAFDPIAKKPGGGTGPVTPTLTVKNLGPGNALNATALLIFERVSVQSSDVKVIPDVGGVVDGPDCGDKCQTHIWTGDIGAGQTITFTTIDPQSTIGGEEGLQYKGTVIVTDTLETLTSTEPVSATAVGNITHLANLLPRKTAPRVIGQGQLMTYTIEVWNSALSTDVPPQPWVTDTMPVSVTLEHVNDGGDAFEVDGQTVVSWTLPSMSPGDRVRRSYVVRVDDDLISGTQIVNQDYRTFWYEVEDKAIFSNTGKPVTTTVREVGLIDSFKRVTPTLALPGPENELTFTLHVVNSGPTPLTDVRVEDFLPWQDSTYQRNALATSGQVISDIVSVHWQGAVDAFSEELITLTVKVDPFYKGPITNTAVITHPDLLEEVVVDAVAYITDEPVLRITKSASPDPVPSDSELEYTIRVQNLGQDATNLVITDTVPTETTYVEGSATRNGQLLGDQLRWKLPLLPAGESTSYQFRVLVGRQDEVINYAYGVRSEQGISDLGDPVVTPVDIQGGELYLPLIARP